MASIIRPGDQRKQPGILGPANRISQLRPSIGPCSRRRHRWPTLNNQIAVLQREKRLQEAAVDAEKTRLQQTRVAIGDLPKQRGTLENERAGLIASQQALDEEKNRADLTANLIKDIAQGRTEATINQNMVTIVGTEGLTAPKHYRLDKLAPWFPIVVETMNETTKARTEANDATKQFTQAREEVKKLRPEANPAIQRSQKAAMAAKQFLASQQGRGGFCPALYISSPNHPVMTIHLIRKTACRLRFGRS